MTHDDDARVADLLARLGDGDSKELFRRLLEAGMQELIDAELTAVIGRPSRTDRGPVEPAQRWPVPVAVDAGWGCGTQDPEGAGGVVLPVAARASPAGRSGAVGCDHDRVHDRHLDPEGR